MKIFQFIIRIITCCTLLLYFSTVCLGQGRFEDNVKVSPKSPESASLGVFDNIPVSHYTGVPDIQIPLYEIKAGGTSIPISLSYHASGLKVSDYSSWVGSGWTVRGTGAVNRQQRGILDETMIAGYRIYSGEISNQIKFLESNGFVSSGLFYNIPSSYDTESDIFSYSYPGGGAKFYLEPDGKSYCMPQNKSVITPKGTFVTGNGPSCFREWSIIDEQGVKYSYGDQEVVSSDPAFGTASLPITNTWYLTSIEFPNGDIVSYSYEPYSYKLPIQVSRTKIITTNTSLSEQSIVKYDRVLRLSSIYFPGGHLNFISGGYRKDLPKDKVLDRVELYDEKNILLKSFRLKTNNPAGIVSAEQLDPANSFRLFLDSVKIYDGKQNHIGSYTMSYNRNQEIIPRNSFSQDFWGYYNGQDNKSMYPAIYFRSEQAVNGSYTFTMLGDANRSVDTVRAQFGVMRSMTYPTGGRTEFSFESNHAFLGEVSPFYSYDLEHSTTIKPRSFNYYLVNNSQGNVEGYSQEFTVGNVDITGVSINSFDSHFMNYDNSGCANISMPYPGGGPVAVLYTNPCYQINLLEKQPDGSFRQIITDMYFPFNEYFGSINNMIKSNRTYKVQIIFKGNTQGMAYATFTWIEKSEGSTDPSLMSNGPYFVGGLRVRSIRHYDPVSGTTSIRNYSYLNYNGTTSGTIAALPAYFYHKKDCSSGNTLLEANYFTDRNQSSIFDTEGSGIGYSTVTEYRDDNRILGKTVFRYTSNSYHAGASFYPDENVINSYIYPFVPIHSYEWRRGKLVSQYTYLSTSDGGDRLVSAVDNTYRQLPSSDINYRSSPNLKMLPFIIDCDDNLYSYSTNLYYNSTEVFQLTKTRKELFGDKGGSTIVETAYEYSPTSLQKSTETISSSDGRTVKKYFTYPPDYDLSTAGDNSSRGILNLFLKNIIGSPIENLETIVDSSGQGVLVGGLLYSYNPNRPVLDTVFTLDIGKPVLLSSFIRSSIGSGLFRKDNRYRSEGIFYSYDRKLNPVEFSKTNGPREVYLWGYRNMYPVARILGSNFGTVNSVVSQQQIDDAVDTGNDLALRNVLNALRTDIRTKGAMITSYTHNPLFGITSETDPKGSTTYYNYDVMGRLLSIRDQKDNIVSNFRYAYANHGSGDNGESRPEPVATYLNKAVSRVFYRNTCGDGRQGLPVTYSVVAGTYVSLISQADADALANANITANGQDYANTYGQCDPPIPDDAVVLILDAQMDGMETDVLISDGKGFSRQLSFPSSINGDVSIQLPVDGRVGTEYTLRFISRKVLGPNGPNSLCNAYSYTLDNGLRWLLRDGSTTSQSCYVDCSSVPFEGGRTYKITASME